MGFTHQLITGVWAGNDNNASMNAAAGSPSVQLWRVFMGGAGTSTPLSEAPSEESSELSSEVQPEKGEHSDISGILEGIDLE